MSDLLRYCKAYPARRFQEFPDWTGQAVAAAPKPQSENGPETKPVDDDYLFLHENYTVTRGIMADEEVVFDQVSPAWIDFCRTVLEFQIPEDLADGVGSGETVSEAHAVNAGA